MSEPSLILLTVLQGLRLWYSKKDKIDGRAKKKHCWQSR